jgi:hypothetical protein
MRWRLGPLQELPDDSAPSTYITYRGKSVRCAYSAGVTKSVLDQGVEQLVNYCECVRVPTCSLPRCEVVVDLKRIRWS